MIREKLLKEISDSIVGKDCKYEDKYLEIEIEIDKISSVTQEIPNFRKVIDDCEYLLSNFTKDLKLISWWVYSNFKINGIIGLEYSIDCFIEFINKFHLHFYPKSINLRLNTIDWLEINLLKDLQNNENLKNSAKNSLLHEKLLELSSNLVETIKNDRDYFKDLIKLIKPSIVEIVNNYDVKEKELNSEEVLPTHIKEEISEIKQYTVDSKITEILSEFDANKVFRDFKKYALLLSKYYRSNNSSDLKSLRINRFMFLLEFEGLPISNGKRTSIYPPLVTDIELVENLMRQNKYNEMLVLAEEILEDCPFWLDGHYYTYNALLNIGMIDYAEEIKQNFVNFVNMNRQIVNLTFIEDTPFISLKTKKWIEKKEKITTNKNNEKEENFFQNIDNLINDNNINDSINSFQIKINSSKNFEEKFNIRLKFSEYILSIGKKDMGKFFLEDLVNEIKYFNLIDWNPELASEVYKLVLSNFSAIEFGENNFESIYKNLCKIDLNSALEINLN